MGSSEDTLRDHLRQHTQCLFGKSAALYCCPPITEQEGLEVGLPRVAAEFQQFLRNGGDLEFDAFIVEFTDGGAGRSLDALCSTVRSLFEFLSDHDPAGGACMRAKVDSPDWLFSFGDCKFYPIALAPCYAAESSRFNYGHTSTVILFQPVAAFERRHEPGGESIPSRLREQIRRAFHCKGQEYNLNITLGPCECFRVIKPLRNNDALVRWWEAPLYTDSHNLALDDKG